MAKSWTVTLEQDGEDLIVPLTEEMLEGTNISMGDTIEWIDNQDGSWTIRKKDSDKVWVLVEAISTFRQRYMVQAPVDHPEYALDTVACGEAKEFSQEWLGETIVSSRVVERTEALQICDEDNDYAAGWEDEYKMTTFFTFEDEEEPIEEDVDHPFPNFGGEKCAVCGYTREDMGQGICAYSQCGLRLNKK